jgi:predicted O-methyltransferase YrrM
MKKRAHLCAALLLRARYRLPTIHIEDIVGSDATSIVPLTKVGICIPPYCAPHDHDDFAALMSIARCTRPRLILELGTAFGNTTANLCHYCPEATLVTVNAPAERQTGTMTTFSLAADEIGRVYREHGFEDRVRQVLCNTLDLELGPVLGGDEIDLAIIDACHDTEYVLNDFAKVRPHLAPKGIILLHDTHPSLRDHLIGSYTACMLLRRRGFNICHIAGTWWGFWRHN